MKCLNKYKYRNSYHIKLLFFTIIALCIRDFSVQAQINISGTVLSGDKSPIPYVNVVIENSQDSTSFWGSATNNNGEFSFKVPAGNYVLNVSVIGYEPANKAINISSTQKEVILEPIILFESITQLGEVEITARRPVIEKQADRTIINVQNSITSVGGSVLDILQKAPGVLVNQQSNNFMMNGKSGVLVMINNKISRLPTGALIQMLGGMSAASVGQIELISKPPANYDAEGNAGIIHIVLKENPDQGTKGSYGLTAGFNYGEILKANFNISHRSKRFNYYLNYSIDS
jgi:hypothetical protein